MAVAALGFVAFDQWRAASSVAPREGLHLDLAYLAGMEGLAAFNGALATSPDGKTVVAAGVREGIRMLFMWRVGQPQGTPLDGTDGVNGVAVSPDGLSVAIISSASAVVRVSVTDRQLRVVDPGTQNDSRIWWVRWVKAFAFRINKCSYPTCLTHPTSLIVHSSALIIGVAAADAFCRRFG